MILTPFKNAVSRLEVLIGETAHDLPQVTIFAHERRLVRTQLLEQGLEKLDLPHKRQKSFEVTFKPILLSLSKNYDKSLNCY